jgi:hypothetical protein
MRVLKTNELENLVRGTFPAKPGFSVESDLGLTPSRMPAVAFVHGGPDPYLDRQLDDWLKGGPKFVGLYPLLNRLCRAGALAPGAYAVTGAGMA